VAETPCSVHNVCCTVNPFLRETDVVYSFTYLISYLLCYLLTYLITYSLHIRSPFLEAERFSASQVIHGNLWKPNVHYHSHKCPPPVHILIQINPIHASPSHFLGIRFNIILPSMPRSPKWSLSFTFHHQNPLCSSTLSMLAGCPAHPILLDLITRKIYVEHYR